MKKFLLTLGIVIVVASCSRQADDITGVQTPVKPTYFSKVTRWKDNRTPSVDTVWTLHLFSQVMVDSFARYDGKIYMETTTYVEQGVMWSK